MSINIKFYHAPVRIWNFIIFSNVKIILQYLKEAIIFTLEQSILTKLLSLSYRIIIFAPSYTFRHICVPKKLNLLHLMLCIHCLCIYIYGQEQENKDLVHIWVCSDVLKLSLAPRDLFPPKHSRPRVGVGRVEEYGAGFRAGKHQFCYLITIASSV